MTLLRKKGSGHQSSFSDQSGHWSKWQFHETIAPDHHSQTKVVKIAISRKNSSRPSFPDQSGQNVIFTKKLLRPSFIILRQNGKNDTFTKKGFRPSLIILRPKWSKWQFHDKIASGHHPQTKMVKMAISRKNCYRPTTLLILGPKWSN